MLKTTEAVEINEEEVAELLAKKRGKFMEAVENEELGILFHRNTDVIQQYQTMDVIAVPEELQPSEGNMNRLQDLIQEIIWEYGTQTRKDALELLIMDLVLYSGKNKFTEDMRDKYIILKYGYPQLIEKIFIDQIFNEDCFN